MVEFSPSTGTGGLVGSSSMSGNTVSVGDFVYGHFSYDTVTGLIGNFGAGPVYSASGAGNSVVANLAGHNLALASTTSDSTLVQVSNNAAILGGGDSLAIGNVQENAAASQMMVLDFFDQTGNALANDSIPGTIDASAFSQSTFYYLYTNKGNRNMMGANGALTSLTLVTAVPEADSYAMLLSGLGILGLLARRRRQK
ncbi:PEP-CTERM sorting domain-containing protein [Duganella flavida]|nr:PEP-CTERM sorting domain-containing protein [Duganella flavida]